MITKNLYMLVFIVSLLAIPQMASAHDGDKHGDKSGHKHHHKICESSALSADNANLCRETMKTLHEKNKALFEQAHALHKKLHDVLTAENFDKKEFLSLKNKIQGLRQKAERNRDEAIATIAGMLPAKERAHLLKHARGGKHHHRHGHHKHGQHAGHKHGDDAQQDSNVKWNDNSGDYSHLNH